jgi:hypothetical protein
MLPETFEPAISAGERSQTHALDRAALGPAQKTGIGKNFFHILISANLRPTVLRFTHTHNNTVLPICLGSTKFYILFRNAKFVAEQLIEARKFLSQMNSLKKK